MGTLRDLRRGDKERSEADSEKGRLFARLEELRSGQGKAWKEISQIIQEEGFGESDESLTANALRKRYARWKGTEESVSGKPSVGSGPKSSRAHGGSDSDRVQKTRTESSPRQFEGGAALPAVSPESALASTIAALVTLNNQLLEQVRESNSLMQRLEKRLEDQELKTSHTGSDTEQPVTTRDLLELLKEMSAGRGRQMQYVEEEKEYYVPREEIQQLIVETVEDKVESELKAMLSQEGSFSKELSRLVDQRLKTLFSGGEPVAKAALAGPGRGKKGRTHKKFSASLEEGLFERVKSLPGQFSGHLANALEAYLSVVEEKTD